MDIRDTKVVNFYRYIKKNTFIIEKMLLLLKNFKNTFIIEKFQNIIEKYK